MASRFALPLTVAVMAVAAVPSAAWAKDSLHGKWSAVLTTDDGKEVKDTVEFTAGDLLTSDRMKAGGYEAAAYTGRSGHAGSAETFEATLTNKAGDTAKWTGEVLGGQLTGTLTITKKDGSAVSYSLKGERK